MEALKIDDQVTLRQIDKSNVAQFFKLIQRNRNYLRQWLAWLDFTKTENDLLGFITRTTAEIAEEKSLCYLIWNQQEIVGIIHLREIDRSNKKAMIGYWVGEEFRGQGFAKKATKAVVEFAFEHLNLNRIEIRCATGNTASQAIPKSLGFKEEGVLRANEWLYDHFVDHLVFSTLASEWTQNGATGTNSNHSST